jgi:hypothetical protein
MRTIHFRSFALAVAAFAAAAGTVAAQERPTGLLNTLEVRQLVTRDTHTATASTYRGTKIAQAAVHCDRLASLSKEEAKEATAAAEMHKQLANVGR